MFKKQKIESITEFLARGGKITVLPTKTPPNMKEIIKNTSNMGPVTILSLEEADLFYGEPQPTKTTKSLKKQSTLDLSALPPALKEKLLSKLKNEVDDEEG